MKFTIVTPCWNAASWISDTALSVANQRLDFAAHSVEYIVVDGLSNDGTVDVLRDSWPTSSQVTLQVIAQSDTGMYDALATGLTEASGEVLSYLNAGDYYSPYALSTVASVMQDETVSWLTGMRVTYTSEGVINSAKAPYRYRRRDIRSGYHGVIGRGRFIQQESTFWRSSLLNTVDIDALRSLRLAGDLYLWTRFATVAELEVVAAHLGGFRFHGDHLSDAMSAYKAEAQGFLASRAPWDAGRLRAPLVEVLSWVPVPLRRYLPGGRGIFCWEKTSHAWDRLSRQSQVPAARAQGE